MIVWRAPWSRGAGDDRIEDRHQHVHALDREARLAGERAVQESLEDFDLRDAIEQFQRTAGSIGGRKRPDSKACRSQVRSSGTNTCEMSKPVVEQ